MRLSETLARWLPLTVSGLALLIAGLASFSHSPGAGSEKPVKEIQVRAQRFHFTPSEIDIERGTKLVLKIASQDVVHGLNIIGTKISVLIPPEGHGEATLTFEPEAPGKYPFKCSKVCGPGHLKMRGVIEVR